MFKPPKQPLYSLKYINNGSLIKQTTLIDVSKFQTKSIGSRYGEVLFVPEFTELTYKIYPWLEVHCYIYKKSLPHSKNRKEKIVILYIKNKSVNNTDKTFLYSQGESTTLGTSFPFGLDLSSVMYCNVIAYDYCGFGLSQGKASLLSIKNDIEEVASFTTNCLNIKQSSLLGFGKGIGATPSLHLLRSFDYPNILGLILLSPFNLELQKEIKNANTNCELFTNCPCFIIHGKANQRISYNESKKLSMKFTKVYEWYPSSGDHSNILTILRNKFYEKGKHFTKQISRNKFCDNINTNLETDFHVQYKCVNSSSKNKNTLLSFDYNYIEEHLPSPMVSPNKKTRNQLNILIEDSPSPNASPKSKGKKGNTPSILSSKIIKTIIYSPGLFQVNECSLDIDEK